MPATDVSNGAGVRQSVLDACCVTTADELAMLVGVGIQEAVGLLSYASMGGAGRISLDLPAGGT